MNKTDRKQEPTDYLNESCPIPIAMQQAPEVDDGPAPNERVFSRYPSAWYLFGRSREFRRKPLTKRILGRDLVAYRTESGRIVIMDARCSHLSADLGCGQVRGENIQCPFHQWEYGAAGECVSIPGVEDIPPFARQTVYPTEERHGYTFFFNAKRPLFELPFFLDEVPSDLVPGKPFQFIAECSWYMLAANGFDTAHFNAVHDRTILSPPVVDLPSTYARRMRFPSKITGNSIFDYLLKHTVGNRVDVSITCWGGPMTIVTGSFRRTKSYILIATQPMENNKTNVEVIVFAPKKKSGARRAIPKSVELWVRKVFTQGFMKEDINRLGGIQYQPNCLLESEKEVIQFFEWIASLSQMTQQLGSD